MIPAGLDDRQRKVVLWDEERAFGRTLWNQTLQTLIEFSGSPLGIEISAEGRRNLTDGVGGFVDKFEAVVGNAAVAHLVEMTGGDLRFGTENGVAAADIGHDGMAATLRVAQGDFVFFAGVTAILIAGTGGEKAAEDTVLGVENGQMVIGDDFKVLAADGLR